MKRSRSSMLVASLALAIGASSALVAVWTGHSSAATTTLNPIADAYVDAAARTGNFGTASILSVAGSPKRRSFLKFDLREAAGTVERATLRVYAVTGGEGLRVRPVSDTSWSETQITHRNMPGVGKATGAAPAFAAGSWVSMNVTGEVRAGALITIGLAWEGARADVASRESGATAPVLTVELAGDPMPSPSPSPAPTSESPTPGPEPPSPSPTPSTAPPEPGPGEVVIAAAGDIACSPSSSSFIGGAGTAVACAQSRTADLLLDPRISHVLTLGDNQYNDGALADFLQSFDPSWGRVAGKLRPAVGNHEYHLPGASGYFDYFEGLGVEVGRRGQGYYSFDAGAWHIVALNSNCLEVGGCEAGSPQELWLRADLAAGSAACTLAYWHHPRWSSGANHGSSGRARTLWKTLDEFGAEIVLSGHDHLYERFAPQTPTGGADPNGIRQFVVGTGGKGHYGFGTPLPNSEAQISGTFGVLELTLGAGTYAWRFVAESGASAADSGTGSCH